MEDLTLTYTVANQVFSKTIEIIESMIGQYAELDKAVTEFKKVSDLTGDNLDSYVTDLGRLGTQVARTSSEMVEAATMFRKNSFNDEDSAQLALIASKYQNVADTAISAGDSASFIISQMKAFGIEASKAEKIIDTVNEVANNFSVGTNDLSGALEIAGSAMATYGNDFYSTIALLTAGTEIMVGRSSQVARGLTTISANIVANQDALAAYDITVQDANGNLKSTYEVLSELKPKWDAMTDAQKAELGQILAGKNQFKVLTAVMGNFQTAIDAVKVAEEAEGSAQRENERYMESYEAKINSLKAAWQNLAIAVIDGGILKDVIQGLANALQSLSESETGVLAIRTLLATMAIWGGSQLVHAANIIHVIAGNIMGLGAAGATAATGATAAAGGVAAIGTAALTSVPVILALVAAIAALAPVLKEAAQAKKEAEYAATSAGMQETISADEAQIESYIKEIETLQKAADSGDTIAKKRINWLRNEISILRAEIDSLSPKMQSAKMAEIEAKYASTAGGTEDVFAGMNGTTPVYVTVPKLETSQYYLDVEELTNKTNEFLEGGIGESQYIKSLQDFVSEYGDEADAIYEAVEAGEEWTETTADIYSSVTEAREALEGYGVSLEDTAKGFDEIVESEQNAEEKLKAFDEATKTDKGDTFKKYQEDYKKFLEAYKKGELGSTTIEAAVDLYVPDEVKKELEYDYEAMIEWLAGLGDDKFTSRILSSQNAVQTFGQILREEMGSSNQILSETGEVIAEFKDGEYYFSSYEDLAKYFKTDVTLIKSLFQNMRLFSGQVELTGEEMGDFLTKMKEELPQYANEFGNLNVTTTNQLTEIAGAIAKINKTSDPTEIAGYIKALQDAGAITIDPEVDISDAIDGIEEVEEEAKDLTKQNTRVTITANTSSAVNNLTDLLNYWKRIKKEMESGITPSTPSDGRPTTTGLQEAKGTKNFQGGLAIVNDGAPVNGSSAELIIDNGEAFIANGGEETPINLNKGAKIYTAAETNEIFNGNVPKSFSVPSFAGGTGWDLSGGSSTVTPKTKTLTTSSTEKMKEEFDKWQREHEHMLAMDEITEEQYYADLEAMIEQYLKDKEEYLDEYWRYEEEIYRYRKELMEDQQAQMEDIIDLQEKLNELERVKTQKLLVYKDGRFQYVSNTEAIANAQRQIDATGLTLGTSVAPVSGGVTASTTNIGTATAVSGIGGFGQYGDTINNTFNINEIKLENVADVESLFSGLKTLALQSVASRA